MADNEGMVIKAYNKEGSLIDYIHLTDPECLNGVQWAETARGLLNSDKITSVAICTRYADLEDQDVRRALNQHYRDQIASLVAQVEKLRKKCRGVCAETLYTQDGQEWATLVFGHIGLEEFATAVGRDPDSYQVMTNYVEFCDGYSNIGELMMNDSGHYYVKVIAEDKVDGPTYDWCEKDDQGATAVTAVKYDPS